MRTGGSAPRFGEAFDSVLAGARRCAVGVGGDLQPARSGRRPVSQGARRPGGRGSDLTATDSSNISPNTSYTYMVIVLNANGTTVGHSNRVTASFGAL